MATPTAGRGPLAEMASRLRDRVLPSLEAPLDRRSLVGAGPFYPTDRFPWVARLEEGFAGIRAELDAVLAERESIPTFQEVLPSQRLLTDDDRWRTFMLCGYGHRHQANIARCPRTWELVSSVPGLHTAFFSILAPGKHIPPHRGFYKGVLRYHLALRVPGDAASCRIRVGDEIRHWEEGRSLVFDDTYTHEVWNDTPDERVVLFCDVERPLPPGWARLNRSVIRGISWLPEIRRAAKAGKAID